MKHKAVSGMKKENRPWFGVWLFASLTLSTGYGGDRIEVSGWAVDGLGKALEGAAVEVFGGRQGTEGIEYVAQTNVFTAGDGHFCCWIDKDILTPYRVVSKKGYTRVMDMKDWRMQDDRITLLRQVTLTGDYMAPIAEQARAGDFHSFFAFLAAEWLGSEKDSASVYFNAFLYGDDLREAVRSAVGHTSLLVSRRAKDMLMFVGDASDVPLMHARHLRVPAQKVQALHFEDALFRAMDAVSEASFAPSPHSMRVSFNRRRTRAMAFIELYGGPKSGGDFTIMLAKTNGEWGYLYGWADVVY